ncbi:hypothetical protein DNTS_027905, partial [Danionella cerebrum]
MENRMLNRRFGSPMTSGDFHHLRSSGPLKPVERSQIV